MANFWTTIVKIGQLLLQLDKFLFRDMVTLVAWLGESKKVRLCWQKMDKEIKVWACWNTVDDDDADAVDEFHFTFVNKKSWDQMQIFFIAY